MRVAMTMTGVNPRTADAAAAARVLGHPMADRLAATVIATDMEVSVNRLAAGQVLDDTAAVTVAGFG